MKEKQVFVKDLTSMEKKEVLDLLLNRFSFNNKETARLFCNVMVNYISKVRRSIRSFEKNVDEVLEMFKVIEFTEEEIISILMKEPSLLHSNKYDIFYRILILGKVESDWEKRKALIVNKPQNLRTSEYTTYARVKYLDGDGMLYRRNKDHLTIRQVIKNSHEEFKTSYKISKEKLLNKYPFDNKALVDVVSWKENKEILDRIFENGRSI